MSYLQFDKEGTGGGFEGCMIQLFRYGGVLPGLHGNKRLRPGVAFNHIRFYDILQIQLVRVLRRILQHCVQTSRIRHDLACRQLGPRGSPCFGDRQSQSARLDRRAIYANGLYVE